MTVYIRDLIQLEGSFFILRRGRKQEETHMIKWEALDKAKEFGGLGFIDAASQATLHPGRGNQCNANQFAGTHAETSNEILCCVLGLPTSQAGAARNMHGLS